MYQTARPYRVLRLTFLKKTINNKAVLPRPSYPGLGYRVRPFSHLHRADKQTSSVERCLEGKHPVHLDIASKASPNKDTTTAVAKDPTPPPQLAADPLPLHPEAGAIQMKCTAKHPVGKANPNLYVHRFPYPRPAGSLRPLRRVQAER